MKKKVLSLLLVIVLTGILLSGCTGNNTNNNNLSSLGWSNKEYGVGLNPPQGWDKTEQFSPFPLVIFFGYMGADPQEVTKITIYHEPFDSTQETFMSHVEEQAESYNQSTIYDNTIISQKQTTLNGMNSYEIVKEHIIESVTDSFLIKEKVIFVEKNNNIFRIIYSSVYDKYEVYLPVAENSLNSFTII